MDPKTVRKLERKLAAAMADAIDRLGRKKLPVAPSDRTLQMMAKAATAVYEAAADQHEHGWHRRPPAE